jgi:hypothetical protein
MSNEPNEIPSERIPDEFAGAERDWRRLLREPGALPGQGLGDKDAAWDKLFERLNAKPRRRLFGYRIAAACLLISLIPAARLFQGRSLPERDRVAADRVRPAVALPVKPAHPAAKIDPSRMVSAPPAERTRPAQPATTRHSRMVSGQQPATVLQRVTSPLTGRPEPTERPAILIAPQRLAGTTPVSAIARPQKPAPKKEWRVVDLNELDPGHTRPHTIATNPPPARDEESGLKINLTTQNR